MINEELLPLYVVILNWNLSGETIACIQSVQQSHLPERQPGQVPQINIIVVDNHSSDNSVAILTSYFGDSIRIIKNEDNLGFAAGVNVGIEYALDAGAQTILLLNNDTVIDPAMIVRLLAAAGAYPSSGLLGPAIYFYQDPTRLWRCGDKEKKWLPIPLQASPAEVAEYDGIPFKLDYVTGCGVLIKRQVFERIGLFDTRYFMYFEDADFCRRARQVDYEIWCVPEAKMWHKVSMSAQKDKPSNRYARSWGRVQFYRTHPHGMVPQFLVVYLTVKLLWVTFNDLIKGDWNLIKPLWQGTLNGFRDG